jgi:putative transposase
LKSCGIPVSLERVKRLMGESDLRAKHKRRYKARTDSRHAMPVATNLLDRQFETNAPDLAWTADITYIPTHEGWLYLAVIIDLYTRMMVGWPMDSRMTKELVINALHMAHFRCKPNSAWLTKQEWAA